MKNNIQQTTSSQTVGGAKQYDAFGNVLNQTGTWNGPFSYGGPYGYQSNSNSDLMLLGHRYYDPSIGRFLTSDPIGDGLNWYVYCVDNPLKYADPTGLRPYHDAYPPDESVEILPPLAINESEEATDDDFFPKAPNVIGRMLFKKLLTEPLPKGVRSSVSAGFTILDGEYILGKGILVVGGWVKRILAAYAGDFEKAGRSALDQWKIHLLIR